MSESGHKIIKPVFSNKHDKLDKSKRFVQIYDVETGTVVIKIYNFVSGKFFKFAFKNAFDEKPSSFHIIYRKIIVPVEDGGYFSRIITNLRVFYLQSWDRCCSIR